MTASRSCARSTAFLWVCRSGMGRSPVREVVHRRSVRCEPHRESPDAGAVSSEPSGSCGRWWHVIAARWLGRNGSVLITTPFVAGSPAPCTVARTRRGAEAPRRRVILAGLRHLRAGRQTATAREHHDRRIPGASSSPGFAVIAPDPATARHYDDVLGLPIEAILGTTSCAAADRRRKHYRHGWPLAEAAQAAPRARAWAEGRDRGAGVGRVRSGRAAGVKRGGRTS